MKRGGSGHHFCMQGCELDGDHRAREVDWGQREGKSGGVTWR